MLHTLSYSVHLHVTYTAVDVVVNTYVETDLFLYAVEIVLV